MNQPQIEEMAKEKKPSGSRLKDSPQAEETVIGTTAPVQVVAAEKEVKAALPRAFTGHRKEAKRPGEFWKNKKTDILLTYDKEAEKVSWGDFIQDFKTSFELLDTALEAQLKLWDLKIKERADKYTYQFTYLAKQTRYNDTAQIVAFKRGLPKSLVLKIMT
ncbi:hypothetical protein WG66_008127 [Moniliophthora roreri]|nr:hypothetical protein WG66_008127 [Moniliophthora roreri]